MKDPYISNQRVGFLQRLRNDPQRLPFSARSMRNATILFRIMHEFETEEESKIHATSGRWSRHEKVFAEEAIHSYRSGKLVLPRDKSLRRYIAEALNCSTMRVSKKFALPSKIGQHTANPKCDRVGRWSIAEIELAKSLIQAFQDGLLPIAQSMTLRRLLSRVLMCEPMRVSKKFRGSSKPYGHYARGSATSVEAQMKQEMVCEQIFRLEDEFQQHLARNHLLLTPTTSRRTGIRISDLLN